MENKELLEKIEDLLNKKYEPILVIKMMRMPTIEQMEGFRLYLKNEFGYNTLIFPGEMETEVKIISVLNTEVEKIEGLQDQINDLIKRLESESGLPE